VAGVRDWVGRPSSDSHTGLGKWLYNSSSFLRWADNSLYGEGGGRAGTFAPAPGASPIAGAGGGMTEIKINVGPITLNGVGADIEAMAEKLFHSMGEKLGESLKHSVSTGFGNNTSLFTLGVPP
jgi:hypothetical protein